MQPFSINLILNASYSAEDNGTMTTIHWNNQFHKGKNIIGEYLELC